MNSALGSSVLDNLDPYHNGLVQPGWLQTALQDFPSFETLPAEICDWLAQKYSDHVDKSHRKSHGQFFTPPAIARFMAGLSNPLANDALVVDPAAGTGILIAALAEHIAQSGYCRKWRIIAYEDDATLFRSLAIGLSYTRHWLQQRNIDFQFEIKSEDFIRANASLLRPAPLFDDTRSNPTPQLVIANPPYFKLPKADPRVALLPEIVNGQPNAYALFMATAAKILQRDRQLIFITPRSFCSGAKSCISLSRRASLI